MALIGITFGALASPIAKQLVRQGCKIGQKKAIVEHLQKDADAIVRLHIRRLLTDSEAEKARNRLMRRIRRDFL